MTILPAAPATPLVCNLFLRGDLRTASTSSWTLATPSAQQPFSDVATFLQGYPWSIGPTAAALCRLFIRHAHHPTSGKRAWKALQPPLPILHRQVLVKKTSLKHGIQSGPQKISWIKCHKGAEACAAGPQPSPPGPLSHHRRNKEIFYPTPRTSRSTFLEPSCEKGHHAWSKQPSTRKTPPPETTPPEKTPSSLMLITSFFSNP